MKASDLNKISIHSYLAQMNIHPVKRKEYIAFYHSPLREDSNPSFKVDLQNNVWYDFGLGKGGQLIDLVMLLDKSTLYQAILKLERTNECLNVRTHKHTSVPTLKHSNDGTSPFSFQGKESSSSITIQSVVELTHPALLQYFEKRAISTKLAKEYCKQIHYRTNDRNYFAIGFKNDSDNWNLRSEYFKGCTSMNITTYTNSDVNKDSCLVFEGFMDYLSYLSINNLKTSSNNIVILNSTSNFSKAIDYIKLHEKVYTYLDNDEGGRKATLQIAEVCKVHINKSTDFTKFKDLNDYHVSNQKSPMKEKKPSRGFRL